jgi:hypothetical protein
VSLRDYYRENGESDYLRAVEGALDAEWRCAADVATLSGTSENYTRKALVYLVEEGRAETGRALLSRPKGKRWMTMWRKRDEPILTMEDEPRLEP